ncbi:MAG: hypothetical protein JXA91_02590 [Candidatus Thermoplasmatota archaeon]|nr:hypothetical protein [Candidatus Thermoplasmatota archaeon]
MYEFVKCNLDKLVNSESDSRLCSSVLLTVSDNFKGSIFDCFEEFIDNLSKSKRSELSYIAVFAVNKSGLMRVHVLIKGVYLVSTNVLREWSRLTGALKISCSHVKNIESVVGFSVCFATLETIVDVKIKGDWIVV